MKTLLLFIDPQGQVRLETHGYEGSTCKTASQFLESALGVVLSDQPRWDAAHETNPASISLKPNPS